MNFIFFRNLLKSIIFVSLSLFMTHYFLSASQRGMQDSESRCDIVRTWVWCFMALSCVCARGTAGPISTGSFVASLFHDICECVIMTLLKTWQRSPRRTCPRRELCALRRHGGGIMEASQERMPSSPDALIARQQSQLVWAAAMSLWFVRSVRAWENQGPVFCCRWRCQMFVCECMTQLNQTGIQKNACSLFKQCQTNTAKLIFINQNILCFLIIHLNSLEMFFISSSVWVIHNLTCDSRNHIHFSLHHIKYN